MSVKPVLRAGDYEGEQSWMQSFDLYYLGEDKPKKDESVDVYIEQSSKDTHYSMITIVQSYTSFTIMNFNPKGLRALANFLLDTAVSLEAAGRDLV